MHTWIRPTLAGPPPPSAIDSLVAKFVGSAPFLRATESPEGGLIRSRLVTALRERPSTPEDLTVFSGRSFGSNELDLESRTVRVVVSVQAGRALANNGSLAAALAAAACDSADWLVMMVPDQYKRGSVFQKVQQQISSLFQSSGIHLDLVGVCLVPY